MNDMELATMMEQIGPLVHAEEVREFTSTQWGIVLEGEFIVFLDVDDESRKLFFVSDLGKVESSNPASVYRWMLHVASVWQETGGTRLALHPSDETVELIYDTPIQGLSLELLQTMILNFHRAALEFKTMLQQSFEENDPEVTSTELNEHYMRV